MLVWHFVSRWLGILKGLSLPFPPVIFTTEFHESKLKQKQWMAFLRKSRLDVGDKSLSNIIAEVAEFLMPILKKFGG